MFQRLSGDYGRYSRIGEAGGDACEYGEAKKVKLKAITKASIK
jgi:hypothetical protein